MQINLPIGLPKSDAYYASFKWYKEQTAKNQAMTFSASVAGFAAGAGVGIAVAAGAALVIVAGAFAVPFFMGLHGASIAAVWAERKIKEKGFAAMPQEGKTLLPLEGPQPGQTPDDIAALLSNPNNKIIPIG